MVSPPKYLTRRKYTLAERGCKGQAVTGAEVKNGL
jgi:hypothetical protein